MYMEGVNVVIGIDQNVFDRLSGMGKKVQSVRVEGLAIDKILRKRCLVPVGPH